MQNPIKPSALQPGDAIRILSLASPVKKDRVMLGCEELTKLGYLPKLDQKSVLARESFFAGSAKDRLRELETALGDTETRAIFCTRGGYGSNYLLEHLKVCSDAPKLFVGYSDLTSLQIFFWQNFRWVTLYGPMVAAGLDGGANGKNGYDPKSLVHALTTTAQGWSIDLHGESISPGTATGTILGGCLSIIEATIGTPWELKTEGSILMLEDRGMKPHQVDRALMHLKHAGKFRDVLGIIMGDYPDCDPAAGGESIKDIAARILVPLGIPVIWGSPVGHTARPMLTIPLGVQARLAATGSGNLDIMEPTVTS